MKLYTMDTWILQSRIAQNKEKAKKNFFAGWDASRSHLQRPDWEQLFKVWQILKWAGKASKPHALAEILNGKIINGG